MLKDEIKKINQLKKNIKERTESIRQTYDVCHEIEKTL
jgi:hypothetical protein